MIMQGIITTDGPEWTDQRRYFYSEDDDDDDDYPTENNAISIIKGEGATKNVTWDGRRKRNSNMFNFFASSPKLQPSLPPLFK